MTKKKVSVDGLCSNLTSRCQKIRAKPTVVRDIWDVFYDNNRISIDWHRKNSLWRTFSRISSDAAEHPSVLDPCSFATRCKGHKCERWIRGHGGLGRRGDMRDEGHEISVQGTPGDRQVSRSLRRPRTSMPSNVDRVAAVRPRPDLVLPIATRQRFQSARYPRPGAE